MPRKLKVWVGYYGHRYYLDFARPVPGEPLRIYPTLRSAYKAAAAIARLPIAEYVRRCEAECGSELSGILTPEERASTAARQNPGAA